MPDIFAPVREAVAIEVAGEQAAHRHRRRGRDRGSRAPAGLRARTGCVIVGIYRIRRGRRRRRAPRHREGVRSAAEVAADPEVAVVDIAVFPWVQYEVAVPLLDAGKHLLCQKPLAYDLDEARHWSARAGERSACWRSISSCASRRAWRPRPP